MIHYQQEFKFSVSGKKFLNIKAHNFLYNIKKYTCWLTSKVGEIVGMSLKS